MKAQIYVNRHKVAANKKATKDTGIVVDEPVISVNTYKGSIYCKEVTLPAGAKLIQNAEDARCCGATIWIETEFESLVIDGVKANRSMYEEPLEIEDYFWQFVEDFKAIKDDSYTAISRRLSPKYATDKQALRVVFKELKEKLEGQLDRAELKLSIDEFDDLIDSLIGLGKKKYYSVLRNPRSAIYLTDPTKNCYIILDLLN